MAAVQVMGCEDKELDVRAVPRLIPAEGSEGSRFLWQQPLLRAEPTPDGDPCPRC